MVDTEDVENLAEFCRILLERVGSRPNMEFTLTWLAGCRMALMKLSGIPTMESDLSPDSLFEKRKFRPLGACWYHGRAPPYSQLTNALDFLTYLKQRQVENRGLVKNLNDMLLITIDVLHLGRTPQNHSATPERMSWFLNCWHITTGYQPRCLPSGFVRCVGVFKTVDDS